METDQKLGSKSPYPSAPEYLPVDGCSITQVQVLSRHGARYWSHGKHDRFFELAEYIRANADPQTQPLLANLSIPFPRNAGGLLAPAGYSMMQSFGQRFAKSYQNLIDGTFNNINVYSSDTARVLDSAHEFLGSAFMEIPHLSVFPKNIDADLNPIHSCKKYYDGGFADMGEVQANKWKSKFADELNRRITARVGFQLSLDQTWLLLEYCAAQISLLGLSKDNSVCFLFEDIDFVNYEIQDSLQKYYDLSYGFEFNTHLACSLITAISKDLCNSTLNIALRFGHAETVIPLITSLGLFKDSSKLSADLTLDEMLNRKFATSEFSPFGANLIIESFDCNFQQFVRVLINERPIRFRGDHPFFLIEKDIFLDILRSAGNCDFDKMCNNTNPTSGGWNRE